MTNKYIRELDILPESPPRLFLRRTRRCDQITPDMDMTAEDNRTIRSRSFGDWDQWCHLRVIDDDDMGAPLGWWLEGSFAGEPVALCVFRDPVGDLVVIFCG